MSVYRALWCCLALTLICWRDSEAFVRSHLTHHLSVARGHSKDRKLLGYIPIELDGVLDGSRKWDVKFVYNGEEKTIPVSEDTSVLDAAEEIFYGVDSSCRNGVCTTCAGKVIEGLENTVQGVNALGDTQLAGGFVCTCQCYVTGPGVTVQLGVQEEVYESQYGQFEKTYGELKFGKKAS